MKSKLKSMEIYKRVKALIDNNIDLEKFNSDTGDAILGNYLIDETSGLDKLIESYNAALRLLKTFPKNPRPELIPLFVSLKDVKNIWTVFMDMIKVRQSREIMFRNMWREILSFADRQLNNCILINKAVNFTPGYELTYFVSGKTMRDQIMLDLSRWQEKSFNPVYGKRVYDKFLDIVCPLPGPFDEVLMKALMEREQIVSSIISHEKVCKESLSVESFLKDREKQFCSLFDGINMVDLYMKAFEAEPDDHDTISAALNNAKRLIPSEYREKAYSGKWHGSLEQHSAVLATVIIATASVMLNNDTENEDRVLGKNYIIDTCGATAFHFKHEYYTIKSSYSGGWLDFFLEYVQSRSFADHSVDMCTFAVECSECGHPYCYICSMCPCDGCGCGECECDECMNDDDIYGEVEMGDYF
jgi:hypothetical protein